MEVPQKIKNRTTIRCSSPISGYTSKGNDTRVSQSAPLHSFQHYSQIHNSQPRWKQPGCLSIDEWMKEIWCLCIGWGGDV